MTEQNDNKEEEIKLSQLTKQLIASFNQSKKLARENVEDQIEVSETASLFALLYEKIRNAVEFSEEHLIRRFFISRVLKRRLSINPKGYGEGENLVRELLWGRYVKKGTLSKKDTQVVQEIINEYLTLYIKILNLSQIKNKHKLFEYIIDFAACEIEEYINAEITQKKLSMLYFLYHTTRLKIEIEGINKEAKDMFYYTALERGYLKNDYVFILYHLFCLKYGPLLKLSNNIKKNIYKSFPNILAILEKNLKNKYEDKLLRYARKLIPPYLVLYHILDKKNNAEEILKKKIRLWEEVSKICSQKYKETAIKLRTAGIRSIIYIFFTKMLFVLLLEIPFSKFIYKNVHYLSIGINTIFPPLLMGIIVSLVSPPTETNTKRIYLRIIDIINEEKSYKIEKGLVIRKKNQIRRPILWGIFSIVYTIIFTLTFLIIILILKSLHFNIINISIFIFFVSVIMFFGYKIRQIAKEYVLELKEPIFAPFIDIFLLPILSVGKILSKEIAKFNIFIFVFDVLIEAPFKLIVDIIEEWVSFTKSRKDEIY